MNRKTIRYTISEKGFKYHIVKGEMKKGSLVSKNIHPIKQVNDYRDRLLTSKKLKDNKNTYVLNQTINVGCLMAYNLFKGYLVTEFDPGNDIVINHNDKEIIEEFDLKNIYSTDSILRINESKNSMILEEIYKLEMDFSDLSAANPDEFSPIEKLFYKILTEEQIINKTARHGIADNHECDIVDDINNIQIEIVTEFKNRLKKDKTPQKNIDMAMIEMVDNNLINSSPAILNKFFKKNYTDKYNKQLGIFCLGSKKSVGTMLKKLVENIENKQVKNNFFDLYLIWYDLIEDQFYFCRSNNIPRKIDSNGVVIFKKTKIDFYDMEGNSKYMIKLKNIFKNESAISYLTKEEIIEHLKILEVS